jgi:hypothetical protein
MNETDEIRIHEERAGAELERARSAATVPAAQAHLALSRLHAERLRSLGAAASQPRSPS